MASEIALLKWMHAKADVDLLQSTSARDEGCWRENARRNPRMRFLRRTECIDDAVGNHSRQGENGISRFRVVASAVFELWHQPFSSCGISRFRVVASDIFQPQGVLHLAEYLVGYHLIRAGANKAIGHSVFEHLTCRGKHSFCLSFSSAFF